MTIFKGTKWDKTPVVAPQPVGWDMGATGKANADRLRVEPATDYDPETGKDQPNPNGVKRNRREPWVDKYARKGKLTPSQHAAAQALYSAYAGHPTKDPLAAILAKVDGGGSSDPLVSKIDKQRTFFDMWRKVPALARPFIRHVVLDDMSIRSMNGCRDGHSEARYMRRLAEGLDAIS